MVERSELHSTIAQRLRLDGQRYTASRRSLVELLVGADRPLTIAEVLDRDGELAQSSAYRNLSLLESAGVVHRLVTTDEYARFELADDLTEHHHHLICSSCGSMQDFTISPQLEGSLAKAFTKVASATGFRAEHHRVDLVGVCAACE